MFDTAKIEKIHPDYWLNTQLSVCRFAGAGIINGVKYVVDPTDQHLVREDVYKRELKDKGKQQRVAAAEKKHWEQAGLFTAIKKGVRG